MVFPEQLVARPGYLLIASVFFAAFLLGYRRLLLTKDSFTHFLLLSMLLNAFAQAYMSCSKQLYDVNFSVAYFASVLSYAVLLLGFSVYLNEQHKSSSAAKRQLITQQQRLTDIISEAHVGTLEWNIQTSEVVFNESWAEIIGYTLDELSPVSIKTWSMNAHPKDFKKSDKLLKQHFLGETARFECETRMKHKNGDWIWVCNRGRVSAWTEAGKPLTVSITQQDITKWKKSEAEMQELNERL